MTIWNTYYLAKSPEDALQALAKAPGSARLIAGGSDLLLELQQGLRPPVDTLVDVTAIPEMTTLEIQHGQLYLGAAAPLSKIVASPLVKQHAQALHEAASLIGGPQVRHPGGKCRPRLARRGWHHLPLVFECPGIDPGARWQEDCAG